MLATALVLALALVCVVAWRVVVVNPDALQLTVLEVPVAALPSAFDGYRIALLADLHYGPQQPLARMRRAVAFANSQAPHLTVLLGDYATSEWATPELSLRWYRRSFAALAPVLRQLRATDGVVAVVGNHDYYASADETVAWLQSIGARVLRNEAMVLASPRGSLRIVGLDDVEEGEVDPAQVAALLAGDTPTLVLSHHPDGVRHCRAPSVRLVVSGHTHGGQVVLPGIGALVTRSEVCTRTHPAGWVPNPWAPLFVSRGVGCQVPVRIGAPPEVVILTLRAAEGQSLAPTGAGAPSLAASEPGGAPAT